MFALEIIFRDGVSQSETLFIRRPQAIIGASDVAHVVIEDMQSLNYQLRVAKAVGRKFICQTLSEGAVPESSRLLNGVYDGHAEFDLGVVRLSITTLDSDLLLKEHEPPDRAGVRILRQACTAPSPRFPAILVPGGTPLVMSFAPDQPILVGRSKRCTLRLDSADISAEHARIGFESGEFWIEDLGSTNGTFIQHQQIAGRVAVPPGTPIVLGREVSIVGIVSESQIQQASKQTQLPDTSRSEKKYPALVAISELVRPARSVLQPGSNIVLGRDPSSDMWIGAPHVSRKHGVVGLSKASRATVTDFSSNGLGFDGGVLPKGQPHDLANTPSVLDFGGGITVAICFNEDDEKTFLDSRGALTAFRPNAVGRSRLQDSWARIPGAPVLAGDDFRHRMDGVVFPMNLQLRELFERTYERIVQTPLMAKVVLLLLMFLLLVVIIIMMSPHIF
jgi:pSer/pThr/pTyr-binding forkhead associated (FHA) protein